MIRRFKFAVLLVVFAAAIALAPAPALAVGCPSTLSIVESANRERIGDAAGTEQRLAQKFAAPCTGTFTSFQLSFRTTIGSPTGQVHWSLVGDALGVPGAALVSGDFTPTASAVNTVTSGSVTVNEGASYWLVMWADNQSNDNSWGINQGTASAYAGGNCYRSTNGGSTWTDSAGDCWFLTTIGIVTATNTPAATSTTGPSPTPSDTPTPTQTLTPTPNYMIEVTSTAGAPMALERTATYGDMITFGGILALLIMAVLGFTYEFWRNRPSAGINR